MAGGVEENCFGSELMKKKGRLDTLGKWQEIYKNNYYPLSRIAIIITVLVQNIVH